MALSWRDLSVWSQKKVSRGFFKQEQIQKVKLLNQVSGYVKSGTLTAVMGASGAGKTTLLSTISGRNFKCESKGTILLNGRPFDNEVFINMSGFVPQQDLTLESLTVLEHLQFMACLKMDTRISENQRNRITHNLILEMGLRKCMNSPLRCISGGERRKVALSVQLLTDPPFLFCDEPTTGLDSYNAGNLISNLSRLAKRGKAVVCTIHQPASGIFESFDEVILMVSGGRVAFQGGIDDALDHFKTLGMVCPPAYNTAEFLIAQLNEGENSKSRRELNQLCDLFSSSESYKLFEKKMNEVNITCEDSQIIYEVDKQFMKFHSWRKPSTNVQFKWLIWRHAINTWRNAQSMAVSLGVFLLTGFMIANTYRGVIRDQNGVQNMQGFFSTVISEVGYTQSYNVLYAFPKDLPIMLRETNNKIYSSGPYFLSKIIFILLTSLLETGLFAFLIFWITGFSGGSLSFFDFYTPVLFCGLASTAYGCCMSAVFENIANASLLMVPLDLLTYSYSGFILQLRSAPFYLFWVKYISRFYYGMEAFSIMQWTSVDEIPCPAISDVTCLETADRVLEKYGYRASDIKLDFLGLTTLYFVLNGIGYYAVRARCKLQSAY